MQQNITPLSRVETRVYLPDLRGGFDVRDCPNPEELAAFIVKACNAHDQLVEALMVVGMSAGFQYMTYETRELVSAALAAAGE